MTLLAAAALAAALPGVSASTAPAISPARQLAAAETAAEHLPDDRQRFAADVDLARLAWRTGNVRKAKRYSYRCLLQAGRFHSDPAYGDAVYTGHEIVGLLALRQGHIDKAARELADSAKTPGSKALSADGPDLTLAAQLLTSGKAAEVAAFLERCKAFWPAGAAQLDAWRAAILKGEKPDFSAQLKL